MYSTVNYKTIFQVHVGCGPQTYKNFTILNRAVQLECLLEQFHLNNNYPYKLRYERGYYICTR